MVKARNVQIIVELKSCAYETTNFYLRSNCSIQPSYQRGAQAQNPIDSIGINTQSGSYLEGLDVIINNNSNNQALGGRNFIKGINTKLNFLGGNDNAIEPDGSENGGRVNQSLGYGSDNFISSANDGRIVTARVFALGKSNEIGVNSGNYRNSGAFGKRNELTGFGRNNFAFGVNNKLKENVAESGAWGNSNAIGVGEAPFIRNAFAIGNKNEIGNNAENVLALGKNNQMGEPLNSNFTNEAVAIGINNRIISDLGFSFGRFTHNEAGALLLGYGNEGKRLEPAGFRSITLGTTDGTVSESFPTLNIRPPGFPDDFDAPVVGIGDTDPQAKLKVLTKGAQSGDVEPVGFRVDRFDGDEQESPLFNVRNDGAAGFNIPANTNPRAPYQFEESELSPFDNGQGEANIVQNYNNFPEFESFPPGVENDSAKWLALGERPPGRNNAQVAYGLAEVWDNNAGNFVLLDQTPGDESETDAKDLAITFQDVTTANGDFEGRDGRNRLRFLFRNGQRIENPDGRFELMSLEPTGEVGVGDYSDTMQQANLEVKADTQNTLSPIFQVRRNGSDSTRGDDVFTVSDSGFVGINRTQVFNPGQNIQLSVNGDAEKPGSMWETFSDKRLKRNIKPFNDGLKTLMKIKPKWFQYNGKLNLPKDKKHVGIIAQEIKDIAPYMVSKNENGYYCYDANALLYIMVNAVQKQQNQLKKEQAENDSLREVLQDQQKHLNNQQEQLDNQQEQINQLRERLNRLAQQKDENANRFKNSGNLNEKTVAISAEDNQKQAMLLQNRPNPYSGKTIIPYYLPENFNKANMLITNLNGQIIKRIALENAGKGELTLRTDGLKAGKYLYSLIVDGRKIQTRKMVLKNKR